jgi:hypothetical protein
LWTDLSSSSIPAGYPGLGAGSAAEAGPEDKGCLYSEMPGKVVKRVVELCGCRARELGEGMVRCWGGGDWRGDVIVVRDVERNMIGVLDVGIGGGGNATRTDELDKVLLLDERESDRERERARALY